jgi:nucleotide-binding universal stress UspA family protein
VVDPSGLVPVADFWSGRPAAVALLRTAVRRARFVAPDVGVSALLLTGATAPQLACQTSHAALLVLGSGRAPFPGGLRGRLARSISDAVATRVSCPLVVVRPLRSRPLGGGAPRVVVGPDGCCPAALDVAFAAARQRGVPVTVVDFWTPDALDAGLEPWRARFPDVRVERRPVATDPAAAVIRASEGAALVVLSSRRRGTARAVTRRAHCPVVVVRQGKASGERHVEPGRRRSAPWA